MFPCPDCALPLRRAKVPAGLLWACEACRGRAVTLPVLRRLIDAATLQELWRNTRLPGPSTRRDCPACRHPLAEVVATAGTDGVPLDVCGRCHLVWFDAGEFERLPPAREPTPQVTPLPERPISFGLDRDVARTPARPADVGMSGLRLLPAFLGMPVELPGAEIQSRPWGTWLLAIVVTVTSVAALLQPQWIDRLALIPAELWRNGGITMLTSFFLHGGVLHLVGNLYFLVVFGDNVEDYLGWRRWLVLVLGATLAGSLLHVLGDVRSSVPCVGASGGISGLIAFYALRFPKARLGSFLWFFFIPYWITFPAWGGFVAWMLLQTLLLWQQLAGVGNVSALAHVGGALVGALAWWRWRNL